MAKVARDILTWFVLLTTGSAAFTQTRNKVCETRKSLKESLATRPKPGKGRGDGLTHSDLFVLCNGGVLNSLALYLPTPHYPTKARKAGIVGSVSLYVCIDEEGKVCSASVCFGDPMLSAEAIRTAYAARFRPQLFSGKPTPYSGILHIKFWDDSKEASR
jgi:TonB family protein